MKSDLGFGWCLQRNHWVSLSSSRVALLFRRQSRQFLYLRPVLVDSYSSSRQVISETSVLDDAGSSGSASVSLRHTAEHDDPGVTWSAKEALRLRIARPKRNPRFTILTDARHPR